MTKKSSKPKSEEQDATPKKAATFASMMSTYIGAAARVTPTKE